MTDMGYYITEFDAEPKGKAAKIVKELGGRVVTVEEAAKFVDSHGVICVVSNGMMFEAAGFADDQAEFKEFSDPSDPRPRTWVVIERQFALRLTGHPDYKPVTETDRWREPAPEPDGTPDETALQMPRPDPMLVTIATVSQG